MWERGGGVNTCAVFSPGQDQTRIWVELDEFKQLALAAEVEQLYGRARLGHVRNIRERGSMRVSVHPSRYRRCSSRGGAGTHK